MDNTIKKIYHYTSLDKAIRLILPNMQLRLSPLLCTNDPRENKYFLFKRININNNSIDDKLFSMKLRKSCKVICFSYDDTNKHGAGGYSYSKMWTHYGGNHQGVCIELDKEKFMEENKSKIKPSLVRKIKYVNPNPDSQKKLKIIDEMEIEKFGMERYLEKFRKRHLIHLFFTKFKEWQSEKEMRVLYFSNDNKEEYCSIRNSITRIFLGYDIINMIKYLPSLKALCKEITVIPLEYVEGNMSVNTEVSYLYDSIKIS